MAMPWSRLSRLTGGERFVVERVRLVESGIAVEGEFELPGLLSLAGEDLVFIEAFVKSHGSIKEMERLFGVSYPTVKNRLNRLSRALGSEGVEVVTETESGGETPLASDASEVIASLGRGELSVEEAVRLIEKRGG